MRSTPGRPYPLIIPLSAGLGKHRFSKIAFSHRVLTTFTPKVVFSLLARGCSPVPPTSPLGTPGGTQNPSKNVLKKGCSKRRSKSALWSPMGRPRDPLGAQMTPKWDPKGSPEGSKNSVFSHPDEKLENTTKLQYLLCFVHFSHLRKRRFLVLFWIPNRGCNGEANK